MGDVLKVLDPGDAFGTKAGEKSQEIQAASTQASIDELKRQFDIQQGRLEPFFEQSKGAINLLSQFSGAQGADAQASALANLMDSPGAKFRREQAQKGIVRNASVTGGLGGGNVLRQSQQQGIASAQQELGDELNRLSTIAGISQSAGGELGQAGSQFSTGFAAKLQEGANAQNQAITSQQQGKTAAVNTAAGFLGMFSDENMKKDIREMSNQECFDTLIATPIKAWKYLEELGLDDECKERIGPMYQESPDCIKVEGIKALDLHDELWLIAGALKHFAENNHGNT